MKKIKRMHKKPNFYISFSHNNYLLSCELFSERIYFNGTSHLTSHYSILPFNAFIIIKIKSFKTFNNNA